MSEIVLIVEGHGDVTTFPHLVGKIGAWLNLPLFTNRPIRAGCWGALKKTGGIERLVELAASRTGCRYIVVVVDLDDECPVEQGEIIEVRRIQLETTFGVEIAICFCIREYEAWLLRSLPQIRERYPDSLKNFDHIDLQSVQNVRNAKGMLRDVVIDGYSESSDQEILSKGISPPDLYLNDRSFRRFVKAISRLQYDVISAGFQVEQ